MEERLNRRSRPRPYDLRRKVLMKNFFREQMSYVPASREISESRSDSSNASFTEESSSSVDEIENTQSAEDENDSSNVSKENVVPSSSQEVELRVINNDGSCESNSDFKTEPVSKSIISNFTRLSNFMKLRSRLPEAKKNIKGIVKAKHVRKNKRSGKSNRHTSRLDTFFNRRNFKKDKTSEDCASDTSAKSIFSLFKSRRNKSGKVSDASINSACSSFSDQFVQTDISWASDEINDVEETNRLLLEENKLLSQSLSLLMSSTSQSIHSSPSSNIHPGTSHQSEMIEILSPYHYETPCEPVVGSNSVLQKTAMRESHSRILRSKSVHEQSEKKVRKCHRAKSMSHQRSALYANQKISPSDSTFNLINTPPDLDYRKLRFPRARSPVLRSLPVNNPRQTIRRRPSMPERTNSENIRPFPRRSESMHSYDRKRPSIPFHALPAQAFY